jgi:hypothetical protein
MTCGTTKYFKFTDVSNYIVRCRGDCNQILHWYIKSLETGQWAWFEGSSMTHNHVKKGNPMVELTDEEATLWILTRN